MMSASVMFSMTGVDATLSGRGHSRSANLQGLGGNQWDMEKGGKEDELLPRFWASRSRGARAGRDSGLARDVGGNLEDHQRPG